jgi:acyl-CoA synthetase (NDP forming)
MIEEWNFKVMTKVNSSSLDLVFSPRTVALIGASGNDLKSGGMFLNSFIDCGLKNELFLVNPRGGEIRGLKVKNLPEEIQLELKDLLRGVIPPFSGVSNLVDTVWLPLGQAPSIHPQMIEIMSRAVDAFMIFSCEPYGENYLSVLARARKKIKKPIVCVLPHPTKGLDTTPWTKKGLPVYSTPKRAARALSALAQRHVFLEKIKK